MQMPEIPFTVWDWKAVPAEEHPGEAGISHWKTVEAGEVRARSVEYGPGFHSDHWCPRGHACLVLEGVLTMELRDGRRFDLRHGEGFMAGDDAENPHRSSSATGARVFIVA
jgi:hypothetical protein